MINSNINNSFKRLCLINHFNKYKELPGSHDILLTKSLQDTKKNSSEDVSYKKLNIEYKIPGTTTKTVKSIRYITEIDSTDIIVWIDSFNNLDKLFKWSESIKLAYLTELIEINLDKKCKSSYNILDDLLKLKYST